MPAPLSWPADARGWPHPDRSRLVATASLRWHVQEWGAPGPVVLLLHGSGGSSHSWAFVAPMLHAAGLRVVAPDLPGHAFTERPPDAGLTLDGLTAAVRELMARLDAPPRWVVGHSAGAAVALELARAVPSVRGVVGVCPSLLPGRDFPAGLLPDVVARGVRSGVVARIGALVARRGHTVQRLLDSTGSRVPAASVRLYRRLTGTADHVNATLTLFSQWDPVEVARRLRRNATPCLLLAGEADAWIPGADVAEAAARLPNGTVHTVPGGHLTHEEHPDRTAGEILAFMAASTAPAADDGGDAGGPHAGT